MKRLSAALLASTALALAFQPANAASILTTRADSKIPVQGTSGCGVYAFSGVNGFGCFDGTAATPGAVPIHPFEIPSAMGDFTTGSGTTGFVPREVGKVRVAKYLTSLTCASDQTTNLNAAINAAGVGGNLEFPQGCILLATSGGVTTLAGQHWRGAGEQIETSDTFFSPSGSTNGTNSTSNSSTSGTHFRYDQVTGSAISLVGDGAKIDHVWLSNSQSGAVFTGSIALSNGVFTLTVTAVSSGTIAAGQILFAPSGSAGIQTNGNSNIAQDMVISIASGNTGSGGTGTYTLTQNAGNVAVTAQAAVSSEALATSPSAVGFQFGEKVESDGSQAVNPNAQSLDSVRVEGFGTNVDVQSGGSWRITNFDLHNAGLYALRDRNFNNPDSGDGTLLGGTMYGMGIDGVRYEFGGGLKMGFTKILGSPHAIELSIPDSLTYTVRGASSSTTVAVATSDLPVDNTNSFENQTSASVLLSCGGPQSTGAFNGIQLDMQIAGPPTATQAANVTGVQANNCVFGVDISGIYGGVGTGINLTGGSYFTVHPRTMTGIYVYGLLIGQGVVGVSSPVSWPITFNKSAGGGYVNIQDNRVTGATTSDEGVLVRKNTRYVDVSASSTVTNFYSVGVNSYRSARITVFAEGILQGKGVVSAFSDSMVSNGGSPVTVTTLSSNAGPNAVNITLTPGTNNVAVGIQPTTGEFQGTITINVDGHTSSWQVL